MLFILRIWCINYGSHSTFVIFIPGFGYVCWCYVQTVAGIEGLKRGGVIGQQKMEMDKSDAARVPDHGGGDSQVQEENQLIDQ